MSPYHTVSHRLLYENCGATNVPGGFCSAELAIMEELDELTEHAKAIGAVNTIVPVRRTGSEAVERLIGDNTDWLAIHDVTSRWLYLLGKDEAITALVIGAGGSARAACYAMHRLGAGTIWLFNRTRANAVLLAQELPRDWNVVVTESLDRPLEPKPNVIVSNVPADGTSIDMGSGAGVFLPPSILANAAGGVAIDMSCEWSILLSAQYSV